MAVKDIVVTLNMQTVADVLKRLGDAADSMSKLWVPAIDGLRSVRDAMVAARPHLAEALEEDDAVSNAHITFSASSGAEDEIVSLDIDQPTIDVTTMGDASVQLIPRGSPTCRMVIRSCSPTLWTLLLNAIEAVDHDPLVFPTPAGDVVIGRLIDISHRLGALGHEVHIKGTVLEINR